MRRKITILIFCLAIIPAVAQERMQRVLSELLNENSEKVLVVAHRGDWRNAPENSLQSIQNCIDMGVDMVEIDLKMTKDSVLVLLHDKTIDRTMSGKGLVQDYTVVELKKMNLKNGAGHATRHQIPTLEEALLLAKGKILVNIDKGYDYFQEVYKILEKTGTTEQCIIKSDSPYSQVIEEQGEVLDKVLFMPVINIDNPNAVKIAEEYLSVLNPSILELVFRQESEELRDLITQIKRYQSKIWINSLWSELCGGYDDDRAIELNEKDESWGWLTKLGATLIQTDRPKELIEYLECNQLRVL